MKRISGSGNRLQLPSGLVTLQALQAAPLQALSPNRKRLHIFFFINKNNLMMKSPLQSEEERAGQGITPNQECAKMKPITLPSGLVRRRFPAVYQIAELLRKKLVYCFSHLIWVVVLVPFQSRATMPSIVPKPVSLVNGSGAFLLAADTAIDADTDSQQTARVSDRRSLRQPVSTLPQRRAATRSRFGKILLWSISEVKDMI